MEAQHVPSVFLSWKLQHMYILLLLSSLLFAAIINICMTPCVSPGKTGDWKSHFTVAQNEDFDEHYKQKMKNSTLQFRTEV